MIDLNSREISTLVWLALFLGWVLRNADVRSAVIGFLRALVAKPILISLAAMAAYIALCVSALSALRLWEPANLKTTLVWALTFAFATMMELNRVTEDETFYRKTVRETVGLTVALVFITQFFTFSLPFELFLVPFFAVLGVLQVFSGTKQEWALVHKLLTSILTLVGLGVLIHAIYQLTQHWAEFATLSTMREFAVPILLSMLFLPFIFALSIYSVYERVFTRVGFYVTDQALLDYAKAHAIFAFGWDIEFLRRWAREATIRDVTTRNDVRRSILHIKAVKKREKSPPQVPAEDGWSPYVATRFLEEHGFKVSDYHRSYTEWYASSPHVKVSDDILAGHLAYYVEGDETAAKQLRLVLDVNNSQDAAISDERFVAVANALANKATGREIKRAHLLSGHWHGTVGGRKASVQRHQWPNATSDNYTRKFVVAVGSTEDSQNGQEKAEGQSASE